MRTPGQIDDALEAAEAADAAKRKPQTAALVKRLLAIEGRFAFDSIDRTVCQIRAGALGRFLYDGSADDLDGADLIDWTAEVERLERHAMPDALDMFLACAAADCVGFRS